MRSAARRSFSTECPSRLPKAIAVLAILLCASLLTATPSGAVLVGINIEVFRNGILQGTAFGGADTATNTPLIVGALAGDTLRFLVMVNVPLPGYHSFTTNITADADNSAGGAAEMKYVAGSGTILTGAAFAGFLGNPNNSLNDSTPTTGNGNDNGIGGGATTNLYRVDYIVQAGVNVDSLRDFTVVFSVLFSPGDSIDSQTDTASVVVNAIPEPASLMLLASGLAAFGLSRRKRG